MVFSVREYTCVIRCFHRHMTPNSSRWSCWSLSELFADFSPKGIDVLLSLKDVQDCRVIAERFVLPPQQTQHLDFLRMFHTLKVKSAQSALRQPTIQTMEIYLIIVNCNVGYGLLRSFLVRYLINQLLKKTLLGNKTTSLNTPKYS